MSRFIYNLTYIEVIVVAFYRDKKTFFTFEVIDLLKVLLDEVTVC